MSWTLITISASVITLAWLALIFQRMVLKSLTDALENIYCDVLDAFDDDPYLDYALSTMKYEQESIVINVEEENLPIDIQDDVVKMRVGVFRKGNDNTVYVCHAQTAQEFIDKAGKKFGGTHTMITDATFAIPIQIREKIIEVKPTVSEKAKINKESFVYSLKYVCDNVDMSTSDKKALERVIRKLETD